MAGCFDLVLTQKTVSIHLTALPALEHSDLYIRIGRKHERMWRGHFCFSVLVLGEQINTATQIPWFRAQLFGSIYLHSSWKRKVVAQKEVGMRCAEELMAFHPLERPP